MSQARRFAELLSQVAREVTSRRAADVCCGDLTLEQYQTLQALNDSDQPSIGALSAALKIDVSTMSRNVTVMERNGYLTRARSAEDGRFVHVRLTAKGRRALEALRCDEQQILADVYDRVPATERPMIVQVLELLQTCLERPGSAQACCPPTPIRKQRRETA